MPVRDTTQTDRQTTWLKIRALQVCNRAKNKLKRTKARFSHLLRHAAWKCRGPIWFRCFINLSLTYLLRHLPTYSHLQYPNSADKSLFKSPHRTEQLHADATFHITGSDPCGTELEACRCECVENGSAQLQDRSHHWNELTEMTSPLQFGNMNSPQLMWLINWVMVLHPTWHNIGHFRDALPSQTLD